LSADEQKVLAIVKSSENDDNLSASLSPVFSEINELYASGNIKNFFGSDMKFMQICLGLVSSTGEYACPWCKEHKKDRGDMSKLWDFYPLTENVRTINEIKDIYNGAQKTSYGVRHLPLLSIEPVNVIPNELHLFMRIFDVLIRNLIDDVIDKNDRAKVRKE
jgi:hypothetical protein